MQEKPWTLHASRLLASARVRSSRWRRLKLARLAFGVLTLAWLVDFFFSVMTPHTRSQHELSLLEQLIRTMLVGGVAVMMALCAPPAGRRMAYANAVLGGVLAGAMLKLASGPSIGSEFALPLELAATLVLICMVRTRRSADSLPWAVLGAASAGTGLAICGFWLVADLSQPHENANNFHLALLYAGLLAPAAMTSVERRSVARFRPDGGHAVHGAGRGALELAVEQERKRIAQDLHDSLGSQLIFLIARQDSLLPDQRRTAESLEECLVELHMAVDRFHDDGSSLAHSLGGLRHRVQPALDRMEIRMHWDVQDDEALNTLRPEHAIALLRIAQEALSNVLRHSGADFVLVRLQTLPQLLVLEISDNGKGPVTPTLIPGTGKGLSGMRIRAREIGAGLQVTTAPAGGTHVNVRYPLR